MGLSSGVKAKTSGIQSCDKGLGLAGYAEWKSEMSSEVFFSSDMNIQEVSSLVPL